MDKDYLASKIAALRAAKKAEAPATSSQIATKQPTKQPTTQPTQPQAAQTTRLLNQLNKAKVAAEEAAKEAAATMEVPTEIWELPTELSAVTGFPASTLQNQLATLYIKLATDQPDIAGLLEAINTNMRQYEELAYLLKPEQLGLIFSGLMRVTNSQIAPKTTKSKATVTKESIQQLDLSGF